MSTRVGAAPSLRFTIVLAVITTAVMLYVAPFFAAKLAARLPALHLRAVDCPPPSEHEQLHLIVVQHRGRLDVADCMYVGGAGAYQRRSAAR